MSINLRASELVDSLGTLGNGVLGQLTRKNKAHRRLDLPRGDGWLLVVASELGGFLSELLENVVDETVHNPHGFAGDSNVGMDLVEHLEDVDLVSLDALLGSLLFLIRCVFGKLLLGSRLLLRRSLLGLLLLRRWLLLGWLLLGLWRHCLVYRGIDRQSV